MHADGLPDTSTCAMPMRPTAQLDLIHELPLDDITVYRSPTCCVCVGTDADRLNYRVLEFAVVGCVDESSSPPTSSSSTDARNNNNSEEWLPDEIPFISSRLCTLWEVRERVMKLRHQQPTLTVFKACALCGCVRFTQGFYLLCVAARKQVAQVGPHRIFEMTSCRLVPLYAGAPISHVEEIRYMADDAKAEDDVRGKLATMVERSAQTCFSRTSAEAAFLQRFCASDQLRQHCFYSHTYDLTNTLQINMTVPLRGQQQRPRRMKYVWNEFLLEPFFEMDADDDDDDDDAAEPPTTHEVDRSSPRRLRAAYAPWVVHLIHGSVSQCRLARRADSSAYISVLLIGRSSCEFCGPRFLRRGVGMNGHVANHVEVEQIVCDEESLRGGGTSGSYSSYVQVRGSVPVRWFHPPRSTLPRPSVVIGAEDPASSATCAHFRQLRRDYGGPIIVLDLLKQSDATKTSREAAVGNAYRRAMSKLIGACVAAGNDDDDDDVARCSSAVLRYRQIDLRRVADRSWNAVTALAEAEAEDVGLFISRVSGAQSMMMQQQHGIIRTNCLDCIDRTNIAQCFLGMDALGRQLQALLLVQDAAHVALFPNLMQSLLQMYLHLGDAVAQQYGGSAQVGAGVLHRGTGWDQWMGLKRLYGNILTDGEKLISLNLFLGRYQPIPRTRTHAMNAAMRAMTSNLGCARGPSSRQQRRGGVLREALHRVAARTFAMEADHVDRAILPRHLVHEAEIDYYLHVHGAPSVPDGSALQRWWLPVSSTSSIGDDVVDVHEDAHRNALSITQDERLRGCMWMERNTTRDDVQMDVLPAVVVAPDSSLTSTKREELHTTATTTATKDDADVAACWKEESSWCSTSRATLEHVFAPAVVCRPEEAPWYDSATFPDEVRRWRAADVIEDGHAWINVDELQRQRAMAITARFGPPHAWSCAHVLEAIGHAELHFTPEVLRRIQEEGWTGQQLLHGKLVDVGGHRGKRGALHQAFVALANIAQIAAMHTTSTQHKQTNAPLASPLKYASSSPAILPHASDGMCFFTSAPSPASMTQRLSQMMLAMMDPSTGVPRRCFRRVDAHNLPEHLHSTAQQHVPLAAVIPNAFSMRDLHTWLKRRSSTLGLSLHIAKDVDDAGWRCIVWLMMLPLVVPVSPASRVSVLDQLLDTSALYELLPTIPQTILNAHVHHVERPMHVVKPSPVVVMEDLLGNALHRFTSLLAKASRQRSVLLPTARIAYDDLSSAVHVLEDVCLHDASLCAPGARLSFFINCFNLLFIHAWLRVALMEHISAEEEANRHLRLADARRMYWAYAYRIGEVHLSLHEIKHGVLGGNVAATYYVLPPFAADDPRLELIPEEVRAAHADAATPTSRELQLLAMAAFMMDVPERTNSTQHRVEQLRERWLQWRSSVAHAVDALPFALLDTYVDARAYPVAPPPTLCAMNSIAFHHRRLSGRAEFCTMVGSSRKWMKECYAPRDLWAPLHRGMHADLRLRLFLTSSTTLAAMSNNANTDAELVGEGMLDATVSSPRRREHRALHLCEVLSQEHWTEQIERAELSFRRTLAQLVKRSRSGADADCVAQFVRPLHVYASMHAITAEQILSMHCQAHVV